mgnify:CR=1 FL=1
MLNPEELLSPVIEVKLVGDKEGAHSSLKDELRLHSLHGREALGELFEYRLDLVNWTESDIVRDLFLPDGRLTPDKLLGQSLTVSVPLPGKKTRHLNGLITQAAYRESIDHHTAYTVTIRPTLWLLTLTRNCRVFQNKTVPDVLDEILEGHGLEPARRSLTEKYRTWDTLTQYRESDFAFIMRLLAHEGLYFFFEHEPDGHTLVLADSLSAHHKHPDFPMVAMGKPKPISGSEDYLHTWHASYALQTDAVNLSDFDFRLKRSSSILLGSAHGDGFDELRLNENYDYPAGCVLSENQEEATGPAAASESRRLADELARIQREAKRCRASGYQGQGTVRWLTPGMIFSIEGDDAQTYLITETDLTLRNPAFLTGDTIIEEPCEVKVKALDSQIPFRLPLVEKPRILGPQTAWVVGEGDEEIFTDKYGRIKVRFHWDRADPDNKNSSCWVRVAQPWAGNRWGAFSIPRVGSEVVVEFLYGDPDRPLVTGSVYSGENLPPYSLPKHKTRSGIKTRSTKGASPANFNEIRFEDKKGQEELHIQAERDLTALVKHDQTVHINGSRSVTVKNGDSLHVVGSNKSAIVEGGYVIKADKNFTLKVGYPNLHMPNEHSCFQLGYSNLLDEMPSGIIRLFAENEIRLKCGQASLSLKKDGTIEMQGTILRLFGTETIEENSGDVNLTLTAEGNAAELKGTSINITANDKIFAKGKDVTIEGSEKVDLEGGDSSTLDLNKSEAKLCSSTVELKGGGSSTLDLNKSEAKLCGPTVKLNS